MPTVAAALGLLALLVGGWHVRAYYHMAVGDSGLRLIVAGRPVTPATLQRVEQSRLHAATLLPWAGRPRKDLGTVALYRAGRTGSADDRRSELRRAVAWLEQGLGRDPVDARAWFDLAWTRWKLGRPGAAAKALALSYLTAPHAPALAPARARLAVLLWTFLPVDVRARAQGEACALPEEARQALERLGSMPGSVGRGGTCATPQAWPGGFEAPVD